jgi:hypothetical protein
MNAKNDDRGEFSKPHKQNKQDKQHKQHKQNKRWWAHVTYYHCPPDLLLSALRRQFFPAWKLDRLALLCSYSPTFIISPPALLVGHFNQSHLIHIESTICLNLILGSVSAPTDRALCHPFYGLCQSLTGQLASARPRSSTTPKRRCNQRTCSQRTAFCTTVY